jgi:chemotaxis protein MotA
VDPATVLGLVLALGAVYGSMTLEGTAVGAILLPAPMLLVFAGTIGAGVAGGTLKDAVTAFKALPRAVTSKAPVRGAAIPVLVSLATRARRDGLLALEDEARAIDDEFLTDGLGAAIDGADPEDLRAMLEDRIATKRSKDKVVSKFFTDLGGYAPTIGIIGTVVSLVHVLENLSEPDHLGPMIAAAFVATLWGILSANMIWLPIGARLKRISDLECAQMEIVVEGLCALQAGANPRLVGDRLRSLVPADELVSEEKAA